MYVFSDFVFLCMVINLNAMMMKMWITTKLFYYANKTNFSRRIVAMITFQLDKFPCRFHLDFVRG